jgi:hypothetical protein
MIASMAIIIDVTSPAVPLIFYHRELLYIFFK